MELRAVHQRLLAQGRRLWWVAAQDCAIATAGAPVPRPGAPGHALVRPPAGATRAQLVWVPLDEHGPAGGLHHPYLDELARAEAELRHTQYRYLAGLLAARLRRRGAVVAVDKVVAYVEDNWPGAKYCRTAVVELLRLVEAGGARGEVLR